MVARRWSQQWRPGRREKDDDFFPPSQVSGESSLTRVTGPTKR